MNRTRVTCRYAISACLRWSALGVPVLTVALSSQTAFAQDKKELSKARANFQRAVELEQAGDYTTALETFRDVGQVRMTPQVRFNIATCEEKVGRLVTALGGYQLAFADADTVGDDFKAEVDRAVTRLKASIPKLIINRGKGAGAAEIQLDGKALGASLIGVPVPLDPGQHAVTATAPDSLPFSQTVTIAENEQKDVVVMLPPEPVEQRANNFGSSGPVDKPPAPQKKPVGAFVLGGIGVAALGSFAAFAITGKSAEHSMDGCKPYCTQGQADKMRLRYLVADISLGVGVAVLGASGYLFFSASREPSTSAYNGGSVAWRGTF